MSGWNLLWTAAAGALLAGAGCSKSDSTQGQRAVSPTTAPATQAAKGTRVVAWRSVQTHETGPLGIEIHSADPDQIVSEPRAGGLTEVEVEFNGPVSLARPERVTASQAGMPVQPAETLLAKPNLLVLRFQPLRPQQCLELSIRDAVPDVSGPTECRVRLLEGDANSDGKVDKADALAVKQRVGQAITAETARFDLDQRGAKVSLTDVLRAESLAGRAATCPANGTFGHTRSAPS